jgi:hypothetical protein
MQRLFHEIHRVLEKHVAKPHVEIEVRFGWKKDTYFDTNIQREFYQNIYQHLDSPSFHKLEEQSGVYVWKNLRIVKMNGNIVSVHRKRLVERVDLALEGTPYDIRLSVCQEIPVRYDATHLQHATLIRERSRTSFRYKMWSYDMTRVYIPRSDEHVYEFEIELIPRMITTAVTLNYLAYSLALKIRDVSLWSIDKCETPTLDAVSRI